MRFNDGFSCIAGSPLQEYFLAGRSADRSRALDIFARECSEALYVAPIDTEYFYKRFETKRELTVKTLLYLGLVPSGEAFTVTARLIDCIASRPELTLSDCIATVSEMFGLSVAAVSKLIDKSFYIYDNRMYDRITFLTRTSPMTAKDALYDIAMYVSMKSMTVTGKA